MLVIFNSLCHKYITNWVLSTVLSLTQICNQWPPWAEHVELTHLKEKRIALSEKKNSHNLHNTILKSPQEHHHTTCEASHRPLSYPSLLRQSCYQMHQIKVMPYPSPHPDNYHKHDILYKACLLKMTPIPPRKRKIKLVSSTIWHITTQKH